MEETRRRRREEYRLKMLDSIIGPGPFFCRDCGSQLVEGNHLGADFFICPNAGEFTQGATCGSRRTGFRTGHDQTLRQETWNKSEDFSNSLARHMTAADSGADSPAPELSRLSDAAYDGVAVNSAVNAPRTMVRSRRNPHHYCIGGVAERSNAAVLMDAAMHFCRAVVIGFAEELVPIVVPFSGAIRTAPRGATNSSRMSSGIVSSVG
jgi:hypothetical protein